MAAALTPRVKEILSWYRTENNGVLTNLCRLLNTGFLAGTGKMVILPVDQGFEHGPVRSFAVNPPAYDPSYPFELAIEAGCSAYAAPFGQLSAAEHDYIGRIPVIVKANNSETLYNPKGAWSSITCSINECLRLGATAVGYTIYPGSSSRKEMYQEIVEHSEEARAHGLPVILWSYARGEQLTKEGETAIDVIAYSAQIACQLGAHVVKVKPPTAHIEQEAAKKEYLRAGIKVDTMEQRVRNVVQSCFNGKRIVIFSGGESKSDDQLLSEVKGIAAGGGFGSIMGRNAFQRPKPEGVKILRTVMEIYKGVQ